LGRRGAGTTSAAKMGLARNNVKADPRISLSTFIMKTHNEYSSSYVIRLQTCGESFQKQVADIAEFN
jgi:hypothetical protein